MKQQLSTYRLHIPFNLSLLNCWTTERYMFSADGCGSLSHKSNVQNTKIGGIWGRRNNGSYKAKCYLKEKNCTVIWYSLSENVEVCITTEDYQKVRGSHGISLPSTQKWPGVWLPTAHYYHTNRTFIWRYSRTSGHESSYATLRTFQPHLPTRTDQNGWNEIIYTALFAMWWQNCGQRGTSHIANTSSKISIRRHWVMTPHGEHITQDCPSGHKSVHIMVLFIHKFSN